MEHVRNGLFQQIRIPLQVRYRILPTRHRKHRTYISLISQVEIIQMNENKRLEKKISFMHQYPPTKLLFIPDEVLYIFILDEFKAWSTCDVRGEFEDLGN